MLLCPELTVALAVSQKILSDGRHWTWGRNLVQELSRTRGGLFIIGIFLFFEWEELHLC